MQCSAGLNGIRWRYDVHGRTTEKDDGHTRWQYRYDGEHRLTEVLSQPRDRSSPQTQVSFRYDPLGRRISKTRRRQRDGEAIAREVTTRFVWEGYRLLQEVHADTPLTYVYSEPESYEPLARIDGISQPEILWFHCQPNGTPERLTDAEGQVRWEGQNSAWGKLQSESSLLLGAYEQNLRMQGQYLDRETGLHYNLFRYYDPDSGRFTQPDPIGLAGGLNQYAYALNALSWIDPLGLSACSTVSGKYQAKNVLGRKVYKNTLDISPDAPKVVHPSVHPSIKSKINEGWTNLDLMKSGYAPIGPDGKQMNLHHILGKEPGPMVELVSSTHKQYHKQLHGLIENGGSFRNTSALDRQYNNFRKVYWKLRSLDFM